MDQLSFAALDFAAKKKRTKSDVSLSEMAVHNSQIATGAHLPCVRGYAPDAERSLLMRTGWRCAGPIFPLP
jgi:hypothetical protein